MSRDITYCADDSCRLKDQCYRRYCYDTACPGEVFSCFMGNPLTNTDGVCTMFIPKEVVNEEDNSL